MSKIYIPHYEERPTTAKELREYLGLNDYGPHLPIGTVVLFKSTYGSKELAAITGLERRVSSWYYSGLKPLPSGRAGVSFSEKDIVEILDKPDFFGEDGK